MARRELLHLITGKASAAEPVSVARVLTPEGKCDVSVLWRDQFRPPLDPSIEQAVRDRLSRLETVGGLAELFTVEVEGSPVKIALEVVRPKLKLVIFGAGHVGQSVALIGAMLGY